MKSRGERRNPWGEGWLIAAVLALVLALSLLWWAMERPRSMHVESLHDVSYEEVKLAGMTDINRAGAEELAWLPGIGEELARRIVEYRENHGPFARAEDIMNVPGVGEGLFEGLQARIFAGEF